MSNETIALYWSIGLFRLTVSTNTKVGSLVRFYFDAACKPFESMACKLSVSSIDTETIINPAPFSLGVLQEIDGHWISFLAIDLIAPF